MMSSLRFKFPLEIFADQFFPWLIDDTIKLHSQMASWFHYGDSNFECQPSSLFHKSLINTPHNNIIFMYFLYPLTTLHLSTFYTEMHSLQSKQLDLGFLKFLKTGFQSHNSSGSQILLTFKLHQDGTHKG